MAKDLEKIDNLNGYADLFTKWYDSIKSLQEKDNNNGNNC